MFCCLCAGRYRAAGAAPSLELLVVCRLCVMRARKPAGQSQKQVYYRFRCATARPFLWRWRKYLPIRFCEENLAERSRRAQEQYFSWPVIAAQFAAALRGSAERSRDGVTVETAAVVRSR